jgi:hypothetical protein
MLALTEEDILFLGVAAFVVFLLLLYYFYLGIKHSATEICLSPYSGHPLRKASDIPWMTKERVLRYLYESEDYANRIFDFERAALCRETGRIFPNCIDWRGKIMVNWTFLNKRFPGNYVSWGSLNSDQQQFIRDKHASLEHYQIHYSSQNPSPKRVEKEYALMKPGPLYVDLETGILIGWKCVPDTDLEVLVVQRPVEQYLPGIHKKY